MCVGLVRDLPAPSVPWDSMWLWLGESHLFFLQENKPTPKQQGSFFSPFPSLHEDLGQLRAGIDVGWVKCGSSWPPCWGFPILYPINPWKTCFRWEFCPKTPAGLSGITSLGSSFGNRNVEMTCLTITLIYCFSFAAFPCWICFSLWLALSPVLFPALQSWSWQGLCCVWIKPTSQGNVCSTSDMGILHWF